MRCLKPKLRIILFLLVFFAVLLTFLCSYIGKVCPQALRKTKLGDPRVTYEIVKHNYLGVQQILSTEDTIYLLHQNKCVVSTYDLSGGYKYTISIYDHQNGRAKIAVDKNLLYIKDKVDNVYIFENGCLLDFVWAKSAGNLITDIDFSAESSVYFLKGASIYKQVNSREVLCVIKRPAFLLLMQDNIMQPIRLILILLGILILVGNKDIALLFLKKQKTD